MKPRKKLKSFRFLKISGSFKLYIHAMIGYTPDVKG